MLQTHVQLHNHKHRAPPRLLVCLGLGLLVYLLSSSRALPSSKVTVTAKEELVTVQPVKSCRGPKPPTTVPRLHSVRQWRSCKHRQRESVTVVTQLSLERLEMLENQCSVWPDPIAAVVYVPTVAGRILSGDPAINGSLVEEAIGRVDAFYQRMQWQGACVLDLELAAEDFVRVDDAGLYPVNAARNRALMLASTEALMLLDADFVPAATMISEYKTPEGYTRLLGRLSKPQAIVLPAFETNTTTEARELALAAAELGKSFAVEEFRKGNLAIFKHVVFESGHSQTNYTKWATHDQVYGIRYKKDYEPYIIVSNKWVPWYDERFRGYGHNKIQHIMHIRWLNVTFSVHPSAFVVHVPHERSLSYYVSKQGQWSKNGRLFSETVQREIREGKFIPVTSFPQLCKQ